jgi:hypothetical protein
MAFEQISHQRPLGIGQIGVHAAGAIFSPMAFGVAGASRRAALNRGSLGRLAHRAHALA